MADDDRGLPWARINLPSSGQCQHEFGKHEFGKHEFGKLLRTHAGWGMRISFVPEDRVSEQPEIEVREPVDFRRLDYGCKRMSNIQG